MKKLILSCLIVLTAGLTSVSAANVKAETDTSKVMSSNVITPLSKEQVTQKVERYREIQKINKKHLTIEEKKQLDQEAADIKNELKAQDGVIFYLSGTAIIIIILLIILL